MKCIRCGVEIANPRPTTHEPEFCSDVCENGEWDGETWEHDDVEHHCTLKSGHAGVCVCDCGDVNVRLRLDR